jgi:hypothetical protein
MPTIIGCGGKPLFSTKSQRASQRTFTAGENFSKAAAWAGRGSAAECGAGWAGGAATCARKNAGTAATPGGETVKS